MGLGRRVWPGLIFSGQTEGRAWRLGEQTGGVARDSKAQNGQRGVRLKDREEMQAFSSVGRSRSIRSSGHQKGWEEREKEKQVQFALLRFPASLGQRRGERAVPGHREGEGP